MRNKAQVLNEHMVPIMHYIRVDIRPTELLQTVHFRTDKSIDHWEAEVTFDTVFTSMEVYNGDNFKCSGMTCTFSDKGWNGQMSPGSPLELAFQINYPSGLAPKVVSLKVNGYESCEGGHDSR